MDPIQDPITNWQSIQKDTGLRQRRTGKSGMTFLSVLRRLLFYFKNNVCHFDKY